MRKFLIRSCVFAGLYLVPNSPLPAYALGNGPYLGGAVGFTHNSATVTKSNSASSIKVTLDNKALETAGNTFNKNNAAAFNALVIAGYEWPLSSTNLIDGRIFASYDWATVTVSEFPTVQNVGGANPIAVTNGKIQYLPRFGIGVGVYIGQLILEKTLGYVGISGEVNFSKFKVSAAWNEVTHLYTDNIQVFSLTPTIGLRGRANTNMSWFMELGYKIGLSTSKMQQSLNLKFKSKPNALVLRVGAAYHF